MRRVAFSTLAASVLVTAGYARAQLVNGGFEEPITYGGPPFVGVWHGFSGSGAAEAVRVSVMPRSGAGHLSLGIVNTNNTFAGVFQDVPNLTPGTMCILSGWHMALFSPLGVGIEIRIEWRNSISNVEISRTPNLVPTPATSYEEFVLSSLVPAGADTGRVVYAIQSFGPEPTNTGTVYVDDVSFGPPCNADFNDDGSLNSQDFFDFLSAFFAREPGADFNHDTLINSQDFFDFLVAFFAGC